MKTHEEGDVARAIARLSELSAWDLCVEWRRHHRMSPPMRISRDLLIRGVAYKLQERAHGGLSKPLLRKLADIASGGDTQIDVEQRPALVVKTGTRLVREWHGETHTVHVHDGSFEWRGQHYRSLSLIAREITGAHWSGPRFFGLRRRRAVSAEQPVEGDHAQD